MILRSVPAPWVCCSIWRKERAIATQPLDSVRLAQKFILTPQEAADFLGVSVRTIRYWVAERKIPYFHLGRFIRFKPTELVAFLESGRVDPIDR